MYIIVFFPNTSLLVMWSEFESESFMQEYVWCTSPDVAIIAHVATVEAQGVVPATATIQVYGMAYETQHKSIPCLADTLPGKGIRMDGVLVFNSLVIINQQNQQ